MKKLTVLIVLVMVGTLFAAGAALAANVQCNEEPDGSFSRCFGTENRDTITGSPGEDDISARQGDDTVRAGGGDDFVNGGPGADRLNGEEGEDTIRPYGFTGGGLDTLEFRDNANDVVFGGPGGESITDGGQGGVDRIFAGGGNDVIGVDQRFYRAEGAVTRVTKEIVDCGPGTDQIFYDNRVDEVDRDTCEILNPTGPDGEPVGGGGGNARASERPELTF